MLPRNKLTTDQLSRLIYDIRGQPLMLDSDLAAIYGVETKELNRAVKRNADRFPKDFMFQISSREWQKLKYQIGTSSSDREFYVFGFSLRPAALLQPPSPGNSVDRRTFWIVL